MSKASSSLLKLFTLVALVGVGCHSCSSQKASRKEAVTMPVNTVNFSGIKLNTKKESPCSPKVDEDFRGLVIATPDGVDLAEPWQDAVGSDTARPVLPVCGTIQLSGDTTAKFLSLTNQILLVAVDTRTHVSYVSNLLQKGMTAQLAIRPTPEQMEDAKDRVDTFFFNANAFHYLEDLPAAPARYHVFALLGDIVSNLRTVEVVGKGTEKSSRKIAPGEVQFGKNARPSAVAADFRGVHIQPRVQGWPRDGGAVWIDGVAQLGIEDAAALGVTPVQKALVVTVSSGLAYRSWNPAGEQALFVDDQERQGAAIRGTFSVELSKAFSRSHGEGVYVMFSVGKFLSNIVFLPPLQATK